MTHQHDLIVIGAGPGGYVAAIRAAQLGFDVACVDEHEALGGTCLRVGCIPSKAMLESSERYEQTRHDLKAHGVKASGVELDLKAMLGRKDRVVNTLTKGVAALFKNNSIATYTARARFSGPRTLELDDPDGTRLGADRIVIATGSRPASLPGVAFDGDRIVSSTQALSLDRVPEHLVIIGAGYIGLELGSVWRRLGAQVTVLEYVDRVLPGSDAEIADAAHKILKKQGLDIHLGTKVTGAAVKKHKVAVESDGHDAIRCDRLLVAVGRRPNTDDLGLDAIGVRPDDKGFVEVDDRFQTAAEGVYAIGDIVPTPALAHCASAESIVAAEHVAGHETFPVKYETVPNATYCRPEVASVGKTEAQAREEGYDVEVGKFPWAASGKARIRQETAGFVKIVRDKKYDEILGIHIIGPAATDLISEAAALLHLECTNDELSRIVHAHPTLGEGMLEASHAAAGHPIAF
jgi:dihydrolipoamide dehydrogenase